MSSWLEKSRCWWRGTGAEEVAGAAGCLLQRFAAFITERNHAMTGEKREQINRTDLEKIDAVAGYLNAEIMELLHYRVDSYKELDLDKALLKELVQVPISHADIEI